MLTYVNVQHSTWKTCWSIFLQRERCFESTSPFSCLEEDCVLTCFNFNPQTLSEKAIESPEYVESSQSHFIKMNQVFLVLRKHSDCHLWKCLVRDSKSRSNSHFWKSICEVLVELPLFWPSWTWDLLIGSNMFQLPQSILNSFDIHFSQFPINYVSRPLSFSSILLYLMGQMSSRLGEACEHCDYPWLELPRCFKKERTTAVGAPKSPTLRFQRTLSAMQGSSRFWQQKFIDGVSSWKWKV